MRIYAKQDTLVIADGSFVVTRCVRSLRNNLMSAITPGVFDSLPNLVTL